MFNIIPWDNSLDLTDFYTNAESRGFLNNSTQKMLIDSFKNEREKQLWILYYNNEAIGSVAAHSFDDVMGDNSYRIAARTCIFTDKIDGVYGHALRTKRVIIENQNPTAQFLIPACIEWVPNGSRVFITSNESDIGTQRRVHNIFGPLMESEGMMKRIKEVDYRGHIQTVWELFPDKFYEILNKYPRWK
jgi:rRNA processing protein Gar1